MAKSILPYDVESELNDYLDREVEKRAKVSNGKVLKKDIIGELANHCSLTWEGMNRIKREKVLPSLPVALKIAEYFNVKVEDIFKLS
jgi:hypothetical protein